MLARLVIKINDICVTNLLLLKDLTYKKEWLNVHQKKFY